MGMSWYWVKQDDTSCNPLAAFRQKCIAQYLLKHFHYQNFQLKLQLKCKTHTVNKVMTLSYRKGRLLRQKLLWSFEATVRFKDVKMAKLLLIDELK